MRTDGRWFDLTKAQFAEAFLPTSYQSKPIEGWGDYCIEVGGCPISFSYEDPGIQICFEKTTFSEDEALKIVGEIADNIFKVTQQKARVIPI